LNPLSHNNTSNKHSNIRRRSSFSSSSDEDNDDSEYDLDNTTTNNNNNGGIIFDDDTNLIPSLRLDETTYTVGSLPTKKESQSFSSSYKRETERRRRQSKTRRKSITMGAPLLSSTPDKFDSEGISPIQLTDHVESHLAPPMSASPISTPYGSLRESNLEGKFKDGPASYRDKESGHIHLLKYNAGTGGMLLLPPENQLRKAATDSATSNNGVSSTAVGSGGMLLLPPENQLRKAAAANPNTPTSGIGSMLLLPPENQIRKAAAASSSSATAEGNIDKKPLSLFPGDRMLQNSSSLKTKPVSSISSSLSAMMQDVSLLPPQQQKSGLAAVESSSSHHQQYHQAYGRARSSSFADHVDDSTANMLSTSLTGLEVLQAARQRPELLKPLPSSMTNDINTTTTTTTATTLSSSLPMMAPPTSSSSSSGFIPEPPMFLPSYQYQQDDDDESETEVFELDME